MTKDVLVSISGLHMNVESDLSEENEPIEVVMPGVYYLKNGKHYILYEEIEEDGIGVTKNQIKISGEDIVEVRRSGVRSSHLKFEKENTHRTSYQTHFGQMLLGINTKKLDVAVAEDEILVLAEYGLYVEEELLADCQIRMKIISKTMGGDWLDNPTGSC